MLDRRVVWELSAVDRIYLKMLEKQFTYNSLVLTFPPPRQTLRVV